MKLKVHKGSYEITVFMGYEQMVERKVVNGYICGDWATRKVKAKVWSIDHLPSGYKLCDFFYCRPAKAFITRLQQTVFPFKWGSSESNKNALRVQEIYKQVCKDYGYDRLTTNKYIHL